MTDDVEAGPAARHARDRGPAVRVGLRHELRTVPAAVWALVGLQLAVLAAYSVLMPTYRAPDEPQNLDIALAARSLTVFQGEHREMTTAVARAYPYAGFQMETRHDPMPPAPPAPRGERPSFAQLSDAPLPSRRPNQQWQHPPLYPATLGAALAVLGGLVPPVTVAAFDQTVGLARLLSALLVAPLPLLAYLTARRLTARHATALAAAVVPLTVPQFAHIGSAVSHDNLLVGLVGVITVLLAGVLRGDASRRTALLIGVLGGLGLLTKGFGLFLPAWIGGVYLIAGVRRGVRAAVAGVGALALTCAVGGWWWLRNLAVHGAVQPAGSRPAVPPPGFVPDPAWWATFVVEHLPRRFWGDFGYFQAPLPAWVPAVATTTMLLAVAVALLWRRGGAPARLDLLAMAVPTAAIAVIVLYGSWNYYAATSRPAGLQGRYLFPGLTGLAVIVGTGLTALPERAARWVPVGLLAAAVVFHGVAIHTILQHIWGAGDFVTWRGAVSAVSAWAPWPVGIQAAGLLAVAGGLGAAAATLVRAAR